MAPWGGWHSGWLHGGWNNWNDWNFGDSFLLGLGSSLGMGVGNWLMGGYVAPVNTWGAWGLNSWGLGPIAHTYVQTTYVNPYYDPVLFAEPTTLVVDNSTVVVPPVTYDYTQPINPTVVEVEPDEVEVALSTFDAARQAFELGSYEEALQLTNQSLKRLGNDTSVHEFRALTLFALGRYEEAAATLYPVLTAGPGWDWTTMIGLYSSVDVYTQHQRALEAHCRENAEAAGARFLLGYHYLVQGHKPAAATMFAKVVELRPNDAISAQLAQALALPEGEPTPAQVAEVKIAEADEATLAEASKPDPRLVGVWTSSLPDETTIRLSISQDGQFTWAVTQKDQEQSIQGMSGVDPDGVLALIQEDGPPLTGRIELADDNQSFTFQPLSGPNAPRLTFRKES